MCLAWHRRGLVVPLVAALAFSGRLCAQPTQPNVVVILTDDAGYSDLGFAAALTGQTFRGMTPHLDALAQQSVVFRQGYAAPVCTPTRVGLLTGLYQQRQGVERVLGNDLGQTAGLSGDAVTMAHHLRSLGYATGAIGKWHLGYVAGVNRPNDMGFDEFYGFLSGSRQYFADVSPSNVMLRNTTNVESQWRAEGDVGLYDPVGGRYVTDALGEEAAAFIDRQAAASTPFFLYVALSAPHSPYTAKQQDYDLFPDLDGPQRKTTAMVHAADRAVGMITSALATHGIEDNTVIVFLNDNGGTSDHFNQPWRDFKASVFEGGVRVPYMIKLPGLSPGVYEAPVTLYDMAPTIVAAAGGSLDSHQTDGVDLLPYLTGANPSQPHDVVYFRNNEVWAIRRGDWKLGRMSTTSTRALFNLATHPAEDFNQLALQPEIAETLAREFTRWEATMAKPKFGALGTMDRNLFDHFVLPGDAQEAVNWSQHGVWRPVGVPSTPVRLNPDDGYANAVLEFTVKQGGDYVATNNMTRMSQLTFMANQLRFSGTLDSPADRTGTINGNPLLLVANLAGEAPQIRLEADAVNAGRFTFHLHNELQLLDDLELAGDGTAEFVIHGDIRSFDAPRQVAKTGLSHVTLRGRNAFGGAMAVRDGRVTLSGSTAAIIGAASISVDAGAVLQVDEGALEAGSIAVDKGGALLINAGAVHDPGIAADVFNVGTIALIGAAPGALALIGDFTQSEGGRLQLRMRHEGSLALVDELHVSGVAQLGGLLDVGLETNHEDLFLPLAGETYALLTAAGGVIGQFTAPELPLTANGLRWEVLYDAASVSLRTAFTADFDSNGVVDADDLAVWTLHAGTEFGATRAQGDADGNGAVDGADLLLWQRNLGVATAAEGSRGGVAEPASGVAAWLAIASAAICRRRSP